MTEFRVHRQLLEDCHYLGRTGCCHILLHRNGGLPWYIVVPETGALELDELTNDERYEVDLITDALARFLKQHQQCQRSNVAAIGNRVPQLHIHVVGRWEGDPCWPDVVWGNLPPAPARSETEVDELGRLVLAQLAE